MSARDLDCFDLLIKKIIDNNTSEESNDNSLDKNINYIFSESTETEEYLSQKNSSLILNQENVKNERSTKNNKCFTFVDGKIIEINKTNCNNKKKEN